MDTGHLNESMLEGFKVQRISVSSGLEGGSGDTILNRNAALAKLRTSKRALESIGFARFSVVGQKRKSRVLSVAAALCLLIYLAPLLAVAAAAVRMAGPGPLFQRREIVTPRGQRVWLFGFRTAPSSNAGRWRRLLLTFLRVTWMANLPVLVNVICGEIELLTAAKTV